MFRFFKSRKQKLVEALIKRGWRLDSEVLGVSVLVSPDTPTYTISVREEAGEIITELPRKGIYADRCMIATLTDIVMALGPKLEESKSP